MPFPWAPIILAGGGLLASLLSGAQKAKERKQTKEDYWELLEKRLALTKKDWKPKTERYAIEKHLPQWDEFMKKALMGNWAEAYGQDGKMPSAEKYLAMMFGSDGAGAATGAAFGGFGGGTTSMPGAMNTMMNQRFGGIGRSIGRDIGRGMMGGFGGSYA